MSTDATNATGPVGSPAERGVGRLVDERRADGMPTSAGERHLRRLLAARVAMPHTYYDDGEAQGQEHGISIDFMREPAADIDAKLRALNVARLECSKPTRMFTNCAGCKGSGMVMVWRGNAMVQVQCEGCKTPNVELTGLRPHRSNE